MALRREAEELYTRIGHKTEYTKDGKGKQWTKKVMQMGTLADKIAALTMAVKQNRIAGLPSLDTLISMLKKKSRRESLLAMEAIAALYKEELLPADRKLARLENRSVDEINSLPKKEYEQRLLDWYAEDFIKDRYGKFLDHVNVILKDQLDASRTKALGTVFDLLSERSEQEDKLLPMLVNKFGDPDKKIATKTSILLVRLLRQHPNMKPVVVEEVERLMFRPNVNPKAQYYALCFLIQIKLNDNENALAISLIRIYFSLFKAITKKKAISPKLMAAILTGVNRAYPFTKGSQQLVEHIDTFFRFVNTAPVQISIQILVLLYQVLERESSISYRYYSTLYRKMLDPELISHPGRSSSFLNILYKSMKRDEQPQRVKAFIKRLLQLAQNHSPPFACGALIVIAEVIKSRPKGFQNSLFKAVESKPVKNDAGEMVMADYSTIVRNPSFCGAEYTVVWELHALRRHYHPSVSRFADCILQRKPIDYSGDPFEDFTAMHFLDRFVYRNPKKKGDDEQSRDARNLNVLSEKYLSLSEKQVPDDEKFIHRYLKERMKRKKEALGHEDVDVDDVSDDEFDQFLDENEDDLFDDADMDFAGDINEEHEEMDSLDGDDESLFGDLDDEDLSDGETKALDEAVKSRKRKGEDLDEEDDDEDLGEPDSDGDDAEFADADDFDGYDDEMDGDDEE